MLVVNVNRRWSVSSLPRSRSAIYTARSVAFLPAPRTFLVTQGTQRHADQTVADCPVGGIGRFRTFCVREHDGQGGRILSGRDDLARDTKSLTMKSWQLGPIIWWGKRWGSSRQLQKYIHT